MTRRRLFDDRDLTAIDADYRGGRTVRCPHDDKPLLSSVWKSGATRMVYFVCRACGRLGAVGYHTEDPAVPGTLAHASRASDRPPRGQ
jgi:hypothetical protein